MTQRESMTFDVIIVGAGPAGLSAAIRLAQLANEKQSALNICVIDKAATIGGHILSGAVLDPRALAELIPNWQQHNPPLHTPVVEDQFFLMTAKKAWRLPTPRPMKNTGNYIVSLGLFCKWLANYAEQLGVNIFPGFAATEVLYENNAIIGILIGDKGVDRAGKPKSSFQPGMILKAKQIIFAEGCRGSLTQTLFSRYQLNQHCDPQTYALGIKEIWQIPPELHHSGHVSHSIGWPLDSKTYGGSFIYHFANNLLAIGFVVGLDYQNPYLNPYEEFQRFKMHPAIYPLLAKSTRIAYGARTLIEGGIQSIPNLIMPGGLLIGDAAGFLNVPRIKGIHNAMKSAMVAADSLFPLLQTTQTTGIECQQYPIQLKQSWLWKELYRVRNIRPALNVGLWPGLVYAALDTYVFQGLAPWTFHHRKPDHAKLKSAAYYKPIEYPKHDHLVSFDIAASLFLAHLQYEEDQPYHLKLKNSQEVPMQINYQKYAAPETRYCPAGVYEILFNDQQQPRLHINGGNCLQCKACDIKDPTQNIIWTPSEGGSGPNYEMM